ncbi:polysaccharide deacetylase family protein [Actinomadura opuntiae]|uniref:polysaccharide deacetylase family protein n=1 Tax=Actinomadura sp. OS1-43 TaxID=604315 RepID=UPI00255B1CFF|nr:polysaccharide deacetylase family protein [Actinomadura sp. OS1-43]MDL4817641.1 polysaccharide deacetylase family protein [Actinomadura sp. OS1-43]
MRTRNFALIAAALLLVSGCGHTEKKQARTAGHRLAAGTKAGAKAGARARTAPAPPQRPPAQRRIDCDRLKCVALTFDDGPGPYTNGLLDVLKKDGVRATFFVLGQNARSFPAMVRREVMEGHEVGDHSWDHPQLTGLSAAAVKSQIQRTQDAITRASGGVKPTIMRPPYGATNRRVGQTIGMPLILWSVDTEDWRYLNTARDTRVGIKEPKPGGVILFHDIHKPSVKAIPAVIEGLKKRGFTFVTVSELFEGRQLKPGQTYSERMAPKPASPAPVTASPPPSGSPAGPAPSPSKSRPQQAEGH